MNEFEKIFNEMNLDRALLPILFRSNRSTVWKYLSGDSTAPASAMSLIMLLQLIQKRNPDLLAEWLTLSDFTIPPEVYLITGKGGCIRNTRSIKTSWNI